MKDKNMDNAHADVLANRDARIAAQENRLRRSLAHGMEADRVARR